MMMFLRLRGLTIVLLAAVILLSSMSKSVEWSFSNASDVSTDVFTQKEPFSGKGANVASDAFGPGEVVILNAHVVSNEVSMRDVQVVFEVKPPGNAAFSLMSATNSSGVASVSFTLPVPGDGLSESQVFGTWMASANATVRAITVGDGLTFKVGWIVRIVSVRTVDGNLSSRTDFGISGDVGFEISLRNIAMAFKNVTIAVTIQDSLNVPISYSSIDNFAVQPNDTLVILYCKSKIPISAFILNATAHFSVLTYPRGQGGVSYSPSVSVDFVITPYNPIQIALHDLSVVNVVPSASLVQLNQHLSISVLVRNEGTESEAFNVSAFLGDKVISTFSFSGFSSYSQATVRFNVDSSLLVVGNYAVKASIPPVPNEADLADNFIVDGIVEVKPIAPVFIHNVAITDVELSTTNLHVGDVLRINVTVSNRGNATETFSVASFSNSSSVGAVQVDALSSGGETTLNFAWDTSGATEGVYRITASAALPVDIDNSDNTYVKGFVTVTTPFSEPGLGFSVRDLFLWLLLIIVLVVLLITLVYFRGKRRRKKQISSLSRMLPPCFYDSF